MAEIGFYHLLATPSTSTSIVAADPDDLAAYARCCDMFDGNDEASVEAARQRWHHAKDAGHSLTYWQQTEAGWERKA